MNAERDDILDALRAELAAVEPSPRFATGVRERVEQQSARRLPGLRFALAAAAVGGVALGAYLMRPGEGIQSVSPVRPLNIETSAPVAALIPTTPAPVSQPRSRVQPLAPARAAAPLAVVVADSGPNLEVITNQPEVIRRMRSKFSTRAVLEPSVASDGIEIREITVTPIVVNEIEVPVIGGVVVKKGARSTGDESARSTR